MDSAAQPITGDRKHFCSDVHHHYTSTFDQANFHRKDNPIITSINNLRHIREALCSDTMSKSCRQVNVLPQLQSKIMTTVPFHSALLSTYKCRDSSLQFARHCHRKTPESELKMPSPASDRLTHTDAQGKASMVNVGGKAVTCRTATACGKVTLGPKAFHLVRANQLSKGDALAVAQLAGIMGAKTTSSLIPLCHPLPLDHVSITIELLEEAHAVIIRATCQTTGRTGVEMEALTAVSVASLTLYDMCKAVSHDIVITDIKLLSKTGGQRGDFHHTPPNS